MNRCSADINPMSRKHLIIVLGLFLLFGQRAYSQKFTLSTNLLDYACLGTLNLESSYSISRKYSLTAGVQYNPFEFRKSDPSRQFQLKQQSYSLGLRIWPWHSLTGWWFAGKARYQEYNFGGIISPEATEGDRFGVGIYAGYTHMLCPHWNLEFGAGLWAGLDMYRRYSCTVCGAMLAQGRKFFVLPDQIMISIAYVF